MTDWIDVTRPVDEEMVLWPSRKGPRVSWEKKIADGHHCNVSSWELSAHCGTHLDAPLHFIESGESIDRISPEILIGDCRVLLSDSDGEAPLRPEAVRVGIGERRVLFRTAHSEPSANNRYRRHSQLLTVESAALLLEEGMVLIGTDRLSVDDSEGKNYDLHRLLLGAGCVILEGLDLGQVEAGRYQLCALPLRLAGAEASPMRALLSPLLV